MTRKFDHFIELGPNFEAAVTVTASFEYDGIGPYEFWGQRCFDKGQLVLNDLTFGVPSFFICGKLFIIKDLEKRAVWQEKVLSEIELEKDKIKEEAFESLED